MVLIRHSCVHAHSKIHLGFNRWLADKTEAEAKKREMEHAAEDARRAAGSAPLDSLRCPLDGLRCSIAQSLIGSRRSRKMP